MCYTFLNSNFYFTCCIQKDLQVVGKISNDNTRFRKKLYGALGNGLRKTHGEMIARAAGADGDKNRAVRIPMPQIEIPYFRYGSRGNGGVGQGEGKDGTPLGRPGPGKPGPGGGGNEPGGHVEEVELTFQELAAILGNELKLPRIEPKGKGGITEETSKWNQIERVGPESLRHFKRTYKRALRRQIASNTYDPNNPKVIPIREDKMYKGRTVVQIPEVNALAIYWLDVSGSTTDKMKEIIRTGAFWIDTWLNNNYDGIESLWIIFEARAKQVKRKTFFSISEGGGTMISKAFDLADRLTEKGGEIKSEEVEDGLDAALRYPADDHNIYGFLFSDMENSVTDTPEALRILKQRLLGKLNLLACTRVIGDYSNSSRLFSTDLRREFPNAENVEIVEVESTDDMFNAIQLFFGSQRYAPGQVEAPVVAAAGMHI